MSTLSFIGRHFKKKPKQSARDNEKKTANHTKRPSRWGPPAGATDRSVRAKRDEEITLDANVHSGDEGHHRQTKRPSRWGPPVAKWGGDIDLDENEEKLDMDFDENGRELEALPSRYNIKHIVAELPQNDTVSEKVVASEIREVSSECGASGPPNHIITSQHGGRIFTIKLAKSVISFDTEIDATSASRKARLDGQLPSHLEETGRVAVEKADGMIGKMIKHGWKLSRLQFCFLSVGDLDTEGFQAFCNACDKKERIALFEVSDTTWVYFVAPRLLQRCGSLKHLLGHVSTPSILVLTKRRSQKRLSPLPPVQANETETCFAALSETSMCRHPIPQEDVDKLRLLLEEQLGRLEIGRATIVASILHAIQSGRSFGGMIEEMNRSIDSFGSYKSLICIDEEGVIDCVRGFIGSLAVSESTDTQLAYCPAPRSKKRKSSAVDPPSAEEAAAVASLLGSVDATRSALATRAAKRAKPTSSKHGAPSPLGSQPPPQSDTAHCAQERSTSNSKPVATAPSAAAASSPDGPTVLPPSEESGVPETDGPVLPSFLRSHVDSQKRFLQDTLDCILIFRAAGVNPVIEGHGQVLFPDFPILGDSHGLEEQWLKGDIIAFTRALIDELSAIHYVDVDAESSDGATRRNKKRPSEPEADPLYYIDPKTQQPMYADELCNHVNSQVAAFCSVWNDTMREGVDIRTRSGDVPVWNIPFPPEKLSALGPDDEITILMLHYSPLALHTSRCGIGRKSSAEVRDRYGRLVSGSWDYVEVCITEALYRQCIAMDAEIVAHPYDQDLEAIFTPEAAAAIRALRNKFLNTVLLLPNVRTQLLSKGAKEIVETALGDLNLHKEHFFLNKDGSISHPNHPECFTNKDYRDPASFRGRCQTNDLIYTRFKEACGLPGCDWRLCTVNMDLFNGVVTNDTEWLAKAYESPGTLDFLLSNANSGVSILDESIPECVRWFAANNEADLLKLTGLDSLDEVIVRHAHRLICFRSGKRIGEIAEEWIAMVKDDKGAKEDEDRYLEMMGRGFDLAEGNRLAREAVKSGTADDTQKLRVKKLREGNSKGATTRAENNQRARGAVALGTADDTQKRRVQKLREGSSKGSSTRAEGNRRARGAVASGTADETEKLRVKRWLEGSSKGGSIGGNSDARKANDKAKWDGHVADLKKYERLHGHVDVPQRYTGIAGLGHWVMNTRKHYHGGRLSEERISELNVMGFDWGRRLKTKRKR